MRPDYILLPGCDFQPHIHAQLANNPRPAEQLPLLASDAGTAAHDVRLFLLLAWFEVQGRD